MKNDETGDTWGKPLYKDFQLDIKNEPAWEIAGYDEFEASFQNNSFTAKNLSQCWGIRRVLRIAY